MKIVFCYILFLVVNLFSISQNRNIDSILSESEKFVYREFKDNIDPSVIFELIKVQDQIQDPYKHAMSNYYIAHYYSSIFDNANAESYFFKALDEFENNEIWEMYVKGIKDIVNELRLQGKQQNIELILQEALRESKEHDVGYYILAPLHELLVYYSYDVNEPEKAIAYGKEFFKELEKFKATNICKVDFNYMKTVDANIAHLEMGNSYLKLKEFEQAKTALDKAKQYFESKNDYEKLMRIYRHLLNWSIETNQKSEIQRNYSDQLAQNIEKYFELQTDRFKMAIIQTDRLQEIREDLKTSTRQNEVLTKYIMLLVIAGFVIILCVSVIFYLKTKALKVEKQLNAKLVNENIMLEKMYKERNKYLSIISHELKTPIFSISNLVEMLGKEKGKNESIGIIKETSDYLLHLIRNIMLLPQIENNRLSHSDAENLVSFEIKPLIANIVKSYNFIATQKQIAVTLDDKNCENLTFYGNRQKLMQVIINLLLNAIKYSLPKKEVIISIATERVASQKVSFYFEIKDQGIGIKKESLSEIFKFRKRIVKENKEQEELKGLGVGLFVVSNILKELGLKINVDSELGKGSVFFFTVIFDLDKKQNTAKVEYTNTINCDAIDFTILIVDDNKVNLLVTKQILESMNLKAITCTDNDDVLAIVKENDVKLILMDINMPIINGFDLTRLVKEYYTIPIIGHTAADEAEIQSNNNVAVFDAIIYKPYKKEELIEKIVKVVELYQSKHLSN